MNRYLFGGLLALIAVLTGLGLRNSEGLVSQTNQTVRSAGNTVAQTDTTDGGTTLEQAGQNVMRQTSAEGLERLQQIAATSDTATVAETPTDVGSGNLNPQTPATVQPAPAAAPAPAPTNPEAIPALW